jgi:hypothetical protein
LDPSSETIREADRLPRLQAQDGEIAENPDLKMIVLNAFR